LGKLAGDVEVANEDRYGDANDREPVLNSKCFYKRRKRTHNAPLYAFWQSGSVCEKGHSVSRVALSSEQPRQQGDHRSQMQIASDTQTKRLTARLAGFESE
jgi:hypothetical protein